MSNFLDNPALFQSVLENLPVGIYIVDRERRVRFWNRGAEQITGYHAHEVVGQCCLEKLEHCDQHGRVLCGDRCPINATFHDGQGQRAFAFSMHKEGHRVGVQLQTVPIFDEEEVLAGVTFLFQEASAACALEPFAPPMYGCLDPVTGIPSQRLTRAVLSECMAGLDSSQSGFGLLCIRILGLDQFRAQHGPDSVLAFLRTTAQTLRHTLEPSNFVGRWGQDEFVVVLDSSSPVTVTAKAESIWRLLSQSEISWWGDRFLIESVVGHAVARQGDDLERLLSEMMPANAERKAAAADWPHHKTKPV